MADPLIVARHGEEDLALLPAMANRHGLVAGATGTGKTVTLQVLAEAFSRAGVPVFAADIKGDLSGISQPGGGNPKVDARIEQLGLAPWEFSAAPVMFWDVFGEQGHPVRTTISEVGPLLLARMLGLNDIQEAVLAVTFRVAATALPYGIILLIAYGVGHCSVIVLAGTSTGLVQRYLNWNERSKGAVVSKRICGGLVLLAGLYLIYIAP
jgi:predicted AAA+ superfamily ATPase